MTPSPRSVSDEQQCGECSEVFVNAAMLLDHINKSHSTQYEIVQTTPPPFTPPPHFTPSPHASPAAVGMSPARSSSQQVSVHHGEAVVVGVTNNICVA